MTFHVHRYTSVFQGPFLAEIYEKGKGVYPFALCVYIQKLGKTVEAKHLSRVMRKPTFCLCENKDADTA